MKKLFVLFCLLTTVILLVSCLSKKSENRQKKIDAVDKISSIADSAQFHHDALNKIERLAKKSDHNLDLMVLIAEYVSAVPYETATLTRIAEIASKANKECPQLGKVVELPIILAGGSDEIIHLAGACTRLKTDADIAQFVSTVQKLKSRAKYKSVDEAFAAIKASEKSGI